MQNLHELRQLISKLMDQEEGCRWLKEQNFHSIAPYTIEEAFELIEAIERQDKDAICDELADQLYHLLIYAELGKKAGWFDFDTLIAKAMEKQKNRRNLDDLSIHESAKAAHADWRDRKRREKKAANPLASVLDDIPTALPALVRSKKIQDRAAHVNFDWNNVQEVLGKLQEEIAELEHEIAVDDKAKMLSELGDILFTCVNIGRHLGLDAEQALRNSNNKFELRFRYIEMILLQRQQDFKDLSFKQLLEIWEVAKKHLSKKC